MAAPSPVDRFLAPVKEAKKKLSEVESPSSLSSLQRTNLRSDLFRWEALTRLYSDNSKEGEPFERLRGQVKEFEDILGKWIDKRLRTEFAEKVKAPEPVIARFRKKAGEYDETFFDFLQKNGWSPEAKEDRLTDTEKQLKESRWLGYSEDRSQLLHRMAEEAREIHRALKKEEYDFGKLELGIHELRRDIRWFSIYAGALQGMLLLKDGECPYPEYAWLSQSKYAKGPFSQLDGPERAIQPCYLTRCLFLEISRQVDLLGKIKDYGEAQGNLRKGLQKAMDLKKEEAKKQAKALAQQHPVYQELREVFPNEKSLKQMAQELAQSLLKGELLIHWADELEACR